MKRLPWFLLLLSLGLNVGLGWRALRADRETPRVEWRRGGRAGGPEAPGHSGRGHRGQGLERFNDLDLSEAQRARLEELRADHWEVMADHRRRLDAFRGEMRALFEAPVIDRERLGEVRRRHARLQAELDSLVTEHLLRELEVLSPEQRGLYLERMPWRRPGPGRR